MRCAFLLDSHQKSGGLLVVLRHAVYMKQQGHSVAMICREAPPQDFFRWFPDAAGLDHIVQDRILDDTFDIAIATWWRTAFDLPRIKAKSYAYFSQLVESKLYSKKQIANRLLADSSYCLPVHMIVEATWIQHHIQSQYGKTPELVLNGLDKDIFTPEGDALSERGKGTRILVEGDIHAAHKNVKEALLIARESDADEVWLLTLADIGRHPNADKVFSNLSATEVASVYRSCDIILKTSLVEGMFGPPLEMFGCGGTAIVYDVSGADEYIEHNKNGIIISSGDTGEALSQINQLIKDTVQLNRLKKEAAATAKAWPSWDESSARFLEVVETFLASPVAPREQLEALCSHMLQWHELANMYRWSIGGIQIKTIADFLDKHPKLYRAISPLWSWLR